MLNTFHISYKILAEVYSNGSYASIELNKYSDEEKYKTITKIVYGVLDNSIRYDFYISQLANNKPKPRIIIIIKIALYCIENMDSMPKYAVVDNAVKLTKKIGKVGVSGFVNALIKNSIDYEYILPTEFIAKLSVIYSKPEFLVKYYCDRYGTERAEEILAIKPYELEHIRYNSRRYSMYEFEEKLKNKEISFIKSKAGGYFVKNNSEIYDMYKIGDITYQSLTSMYAVQALKVNRGEVLDMCSAPGGKAVMIAENAPTARVIACDIHTHRVEFIENYATRMQIDNIITKVADMTEYNSEFSNRFDYVLCDVPCSGFGLVNKKPDILINKSQLDIEKLSKIQYNIIKQAIKYLKVGGVVLYSTCTTIKAENEDVIDKIISENSDMELCEIEMFEGQKTINFLPDGSGQDGFFIAKLIRVRSSID